MASFSQLMKEVEIDPSVKLKCVTKFCNSVCGVAEG